MRSARLLALAATAALLTACGTPTVTSTADSGTKGAAKSDAKPGSGKSAAKSAGVGDAITLRGSSGDLKIAVTPIKIIRNGAPANDLVRPKSGNRLFGVEIAMKNVGTETYDDSPGNGAKVVDSEGQEYETDIFAEIAGAHKLQATTMATGDKRKGVLTFEVPKNAKIVRFQLALNSGFANQKGLWKIQ